MKTARVEHPLDYDKILGNTKLVQLIILLMDRAHYSLSRSEADARLGLQDALIKGYVVQNAQEIDPLREQVTPRVLINRLP